MSSIAAVVGSRPLAVNMTWTTLEGTAVAQAFKSRAGDIFIVTFPKTGTTWCQQICHQLRTGSHTDFDEISEVIPWFEIGPSIGQNIDAPQMAMPRCFKTHQRLSALAHCEGAKFLCVLRDPEATLLSEFKQKLAKENPAATVSKDVNAYARQKIWLGESGEGEVPLQFGGTIWDFYVEMWQCRALPEVKILVYEHLKSDLKAFLPGIAGFMGLPPPSQELSAKVLELSSFKWMAAHDHLFDDHHISARLTKIRGELSGWKHSAKVGLGSSDGVNLTVRDETRRLLQQQWMTVVFPVTGHATYAELIAALRGHTSEEAPSKL